jgi:uncharacterized protein
MENMQMTVSSNESEIQRDDPFASLYPHEFFLLTTFRINGEGVPTTVWFAPDDKGYLYITTQESAGKLKRIRHNSEVRMIPSNARGIIIDGQQPVTGYARQMSSEEYARAEAALLQKYGEQYTAVIARGGEAGRTTRTFVEVSPKM